MNTRKFNTIDWLFLILLIIGGVNWGLVGLLDLNLVSALFGSDSFLTNLIYIIVGISALYILIKYVSRAEKVTS